MRQSHEFILSPLCRRSRLSFALLLSVLAFAPSARAQTSAGPSQPLITQSITEDNLVALSGNTRPEAKQLANDRGIVPDSMPMEHMMLQLRRPAAQEQALKTLIDQLHDPQSPNFHHWLSASELGAQFGPAASDIAAVTGWLQQHGFAVNAVYPNGMVIDYSGTAGQVRTAFHTEIHNIDVKGLAYVANMSDPQIPAALAPAVVGIVSLHNIPPQTMYRMVPRDYTEGSCGFVKTTSCYLVTPADLATIYNFNAVFNIGVTGQGQTIYLIEDTDLYGGTSGNTNSDWSKFRSTFGLSGYSATLTTVHPAPPSGPNNCTDPGVNGDDGEAILDAEYAGAAAPSANIVMATCASSGTYPTPSFTFGGLVAIQNLVNSASPPAIVSISYGECEVSNGAASNQAFSTAYQTGVAGGMSIYVSSGDSNTDVCDRGEPSAYSGISVNGWGSSVYNVSVGGTDFSVVYSGTQGSYWTSGNTSTYGSAVTYIPEIPWNGSCGSALIAYAKGAANGYAPYTYCNTNSAWETYGYFSGGGSGGPSGCATGVSTFPSGGGKTWPVANGTCAGWPKPSWQNGLYGNPADGVRDLPDVALFASSGVWNSYYPYCWSDPSQSVNGSAPCTGAPNTWSGAGGTSFASPIWAGIQALVNQQAGGKQGLPNYRLYQLAFKEFQPFEYNYFASFECNSNNGGYYTSPSCIFYDVVSDGIVVPCASPNGNYYDCYDPGKGADEGVLSTSNSSYSGAYYAGYGWDFATGIGTPNVWNVVMNWTGTGEYLTDRHDFNGDGKSDILWRNSNGDVAFWLQNGTTSLTRQDIGNVSTTWSIVGQRDFNGNGNSDILWRDTSGNVAIWFMNGTQILSGVVVNQIPLAWSVVGTGDFNGDGIGDILWRDTSGDLAIWLMNGTQIMSSVVVATVPTVWSIVGTGDFNGDGYTDILWRDTAGDLAIWFMKGTQLLSSVGLGNVSTVWSVAGTGDFNGDGKADILWRDTSGDLALWFMNGTQVLPSSGGFSTVSTAWSVAETGDFNGDGRSDILWIDTSGDVAIWFMNGTTVLPSSGAFATVPPTVWTVQSLNAE